jgi:ABC-2 type transport system permease protein
MTRRIWRVAAHEYLINVAKRSFFFGAVAVPILIIGIVAFILWLGISTSEDAERLGTVGVADATGIVQAADLPEGWLLVADEAAGQAALAADAASEGALGALVIIPADYIETGALRIIGRAGVPDALEDEADAAIRAGLTAGLAPDVRERVRDPLVLSIFMESNGRTVRDSGILAVLLLPFLYMIVFTIASSATSSYLMTSVVEEKSNRVMEMLVTSVRPIDLLGGKIIGLGLVGLTMLALWMLVIGIGLLLGRGTEVLSAVVIPPDLVVVGLVYFLLNYFLIGSIMAGIGAVVGTEQESRQIAGVLSTLNVIPFFFIAQFISEPNSTVPVLLTLIPFTAPLSVLLRMGYTVIPPVELIASIAIMTVATVFAVWATARIFRWSLLMYGKRPSLRQIVRAVREGQVGTTATGESAG